MEVLGEGFIDPGYHRLTLFIWSWNDFDKFRTSPRTTATVSATGARKELLKNDDLPEL